MAHPRPLPAWPHRIGILESTWRSFCGNAGVDLPDLAAILPVPGSTLDVLVDPDLKGPVDAAKPSEGVYDALVEAVVSGIHSPLDIYKIGPLAGAINFMLQLFQNEKEKLGLGSETAAAAGEFFETGLGALGDGLAKWLDSNKLDGPSRLLVEHKGYDLTRWCTNQEMWRRVLSACRLWHFLIVEPEATGTGYKPTYCIPRHESDQLLNAVNLGAGERLRRLQQYKFIDDDAMIQFMRSKSSLVMEASQNALAKLLRRQTTYRPWLIERWRSGYRVDPESDDPEELGAPIDDEQPDEVEVIDVEVSDVEEAAQDARDGDDGSGNGQEDEDEGPNSATQLPDLYEGRSQIFIRKSQSHTFNLKSDKLCDTLNAVFRERGGQRAVLPLPHTVDCQYVIVNLRDGHAWKDHPPRCGSDELRGQACVAVKFHRVTTNLGDYGTTISATPVGIFKLGRGKLKSADAEQFTLKTLPNIVLFNADHRDDLVYVMPSEMLNMESPGERPKFTPNSPLWTDNFKGTHLERLQLSFDELATLFDDILTAPDDGEFGVPWAQRLRGTTGPFNVADYRITIEAAYRSVSYGRRVDQISDMDKLKSSKGSRQLLTHFVGEDARTGAQISWQSWQQWTSIRRTYGALAAVREFMNGLTPAEKNLKRYQPPKNLRQALEGVDVESDDDEL